MNNLTQVIKFFKEMQKFMEQNSLVRVNFESCDEVVFYDKKENEFYAKDFDSESKARKDFDRINIRYERFLENDQYGI